MFLVESSALFEITPDVGAALARHDPQVQAELTRFRQKDHSLNDIADNLPRRGRCR